jgi:hypothetical protein
MKRITTLLVLAALLMMASGAFAANKCSNATVKGTYAFTSTGSTGGIPSAVVGFATYDGAGNWSATFTSSEGNTIYLDAQLVGTYAVNPDCTASFTDTTDDLHYWGVVLTHGAEIFVINADTGNAFPVDLKRQDSRD